MVNSKKLSVNKIKRLLSLFKFILSQKSRDQARYLSFLNDKSIDEISESIYNILYNEKLNLNLSKSQKTKLKRIIKPNVRSFEDISKKNISFKKTIKNHSTGGKNWNCTFYLDTNIDIFIKKKSW